MRDAAVVTSVPFKLATILEAGILGRSKQSISKREDDAKDTELDPRGEFDPRIR